MNQDTTFPKNVYQMDIDKHLGVARRALYLLRASHNREQPLTQQEIAVCHTAMNYTIHDLERALIILNGAAGVLPEWEDKAQRGWRAWLAEEPLQ